MSHDPRDLSRLTRPPRAVPPGLKARLLFGDTLGVIGWIFAATGLMFCAVFGAFVDTTDWDGAQTTEGVSLGWEDTAAEVNGRAVVANHFRYEVNTVAYEGVSYADGEGLGADEPVVVEYLRDAPERARIQGMRSSQFSAWVLLITLIFPLIGVVLAGVQFVKGRGMITLLAEGRAGLGRLVAKEPTNTRVNQRVVWALTFEFTDDAGRVHRTVARTLAPEELEDEPEERLLYHPARPDQALMMDSLPGLFRVDARGGWESVRGAQVVGALVAPVLSAVLFAVTLVVLL